MNWIIIAAQMVSVAVFVFIWIAYRRLYKAYEEVYDLWQEADRLLLNNFKESVAVAFGGVVNAPCEVREVHGGYQVVRTYEKSAYVIKGFFSGDKEYARRCAGELCDLMNEKA